MVGLDPIRKASERVQKLSDPCVLCAHRCGVRRSRGELGRCQAPSGAVVHNAIIHHGEEPPISGTHGSGTIFFSYCSLSCVYCQNYLFSQNRTRAFRAQRGAGPGSDREVTPRELADMMIDLQRRGAENINLVSPTHFAHRIVEAIALAVEDSLAVPVIYNTGGFDNPDLIMALEGAIDIYLVDMRYSREADAVAYSKAPGYVQTNRENVRRMNEQVGRLALAEGGSALSGLIVRLLVLPSGVSAVEDSIRFLAREISTDVHLSLMSQYHPAYRAKDFAPLARRLHASEYRLALDALESYGITSGWQQALNTDPNVYLGERIPEREL